MFVHCPLTVLLLFDRGTLTDHVAKGGERGDGEGTRTKKARDHGEEGGGDEEAREEGAK